MYQIRVANRAERSDIIKQKEEAATSSVTNFDVYENKPEVLKEIQLPTEIPIYRMANGRTQKEHGQWIRTHRLEPEFFASGEENVDAQQAQHAILAELSRRGKSESLTPIYDEIERQGQTEPILITKSGVVVNGNRRLAAIREISISDHPSARRMQSVRCLVLPVLSEDEIDDIELRLQMAPETKLPYGWINEALTIRRHLSYRDEKAVADVMRKRVATIRRSVDALRLAETYLSSWLNAPFEYERVESGEQFFSDLVVTLQDKEGAELEALQKTAFVLFGSPRKGKGRIYDFNKVLRDGAIDLLSELEERLIDTGDVVEPSNGIEDADDLEIDFGLEEGEENGSRTAKLAEVLGDLDRKEEVSKAVLDVAASVLNRRSDIEAGRRPLEYLQEARSMIRMCDIFEAAPSTLDEIARCLSHIEQSISGLREAVSQQLSSRKQEPMEVEAWTKSL